MKPSHREQILQALRSGQTLTPLDALRQFGCMRLAPRIEELRDDGYQITTRLERSPEGKRYARYAMMGATP